MYMIHSIKRKYRSKQFLSNKKMTMRHSNYKEHYSINDEISDFFI